MKLCDDCGDETGRRKKCPHCGQMVCGWCWNHVHSIQNELDNQTARKDFEQGVYAKEDTSD